MLVFPCVRHQHHNKMRRFLPAKEKRRKLMLAHVGLVPDLRLYTITNETQQHRPANPNRHLPRRAADLATCRPMRLQPRPSKARTRQTITSTKWERIGLHTRMKKTHSILTTSSVSRHNFLLEHAARHPKRIPPKISTAPIHVDDMYRNEAFWRCTGKIFRRNHVFQAVRFSFSCGG